MRMRRKEDDDEGIENMRRRRRTIYSFGCCNYRFSKEYCLLMLCFQFFLKGQALIFLGL
jgi:hypothetical protein